MALVRRRVHKRVCPGGSLRRLVFSGLDPAELLLEPVLGFVLVVHVDTSLFERSELQILSSFWVKIKQLLEVLAE